MTASSALPPASATAGTAENVFLSVARALLLSPGEAMRQDEIQAGRTIIRPGDAEWLPRADWIDDVVVSRDGDEVRIVAILARQMGRGAFGRLVTGICAADLVPVVVAPMGIMPTILRHWGWRRTRVGHGWTAEEQWRPRGRWGQYRVRSRALLAAQPSTEEAGRARPDGVEQGRA